MKIRKIKIVSPVPSKPKEKKKKKKKKAPRQEGKKAGFKFRARKFNASSKKAVEQVQKAQSSELVRNAVEVVNGDPLMTPKEKEALFADLHKHYLSVFDLDNCPDDYELLKIEAKFLAGLSSNAFILMAQRLKKIRDLKLYKEDKYKSFKDFVNGEMSISRTTIYSYMDILQLFGEKRLSSEVDVEYTKLVPAIPILKANIKGLPRAKLVEQFISDSKELTKLQLVQKAVALKLRYKIGGRGQKKSSPEEDRRLSNAIKTFKQELPVGDPSPAQITQIRALIKYLDKRCKRCSPG
jgi:hypothetical protein